MGTRDLERELAVDPATAHRLVAPAPVGTSLYVHFPYCAAKCTYCDFYSLPGEGHDADGALALLLREAEVRQPTSPCTVFLGGGTPSYHSAQALVGFLNALDGLTGFRASAQEVTIECNPESLDETKVEALLRAGVTRISIGVQSLQPAILERFGRVHSVEQSFAAVRAARSAGCDRLSVDLIYAAPGQTPAAWRSDLERVLELGTDHLSAYNLTFEEGTALDRERRAGSVEPLTEDDELEMFWATRELAVAAGLEAYEISNFARPEQVCAHNLAYWRGDDYVGIGPSAVSRAGDHRFGNPRHLGQWTARVRAGEPTMGWAERLDRGTRLGEAWWLGLRLAEGVDPAEARRRADWRESDPALELARRFVSQGLVEARDEGRAAPRYGLTPRGLPLADGVARAFLDLGDPELFGFQD
ncbi:radical SAM family heme chaperone HemW [Engelhardtia mirabilis]|uniref:Heme chaperone HemW n=1 Tax=Engelhardtia mirabilis TaxID=2528011 RepID=A0A518BT27_9BACT|nr:Oxygen-independent coproporphyrinogen-III oxidase-like protein [Planctomycetes bacterium Pla133]QDV04447.1 Oxygen-independent coproporphyrinogen-III oxidase-like protein [Planctomycetes bacterium Pla86]